MDGALACYHAVAQIYAASGAKEKLELDSFPGEHSWGGNKTVEFFRKYLD
ncbi:MAG: hypothetical protein PHH77_01165 [Victivallaceae bacterium]|nr:hypothetical protein [Victivallaceae bacterium]